MTPDSDWGVRLPIDQQIVLGPGSGPGAGLGGQPLHTGKRTPPVRTEPTNRRSGTLNE